MIPFPDDIHPMDFPKLLEYALEYWGAGEMGIVEWVADHCRPLQTVRIRICVRCQRLICNDNSPKGYVVEGPGKALEHEVAYVDQSEQCDVCSDAAAEEARRYSDPDQGPMDRAEENEDGWYDGRAGEDADIRDLLR